MRFMKARMISRREELELHRMEAERRARANARHHARQQGQGLPTSATPAARAASPVAPPPPPVAAAPTAPTPVVQAPVAVASPPPSPPQPVPTAQAVTAPPPPARPVHPGWETARVVASTVQTLATHPELRQAIREELQAHRPVNAQPMVARPMFQQAEAAPTFQPMAPVAQRWQEPPQEYLYDPYFEQGQEFGANEKRLYGPITQIGENIRVQAAEGYRAGVIELKPGLYLVAELKQEALQPEFGFVEVLAPMVVSAAAQALENPETQKAIANAASQGVKAVGQAFHHPHGGQGKRRPRPRPQNRAGQGGMRWMPQGPHPVQPAQRPMPPGFFLPMMPQGYFMPGVQAPGMPMPGMVNAAMQSPQYFQQMAQVPGYPQGAMPAGPAYPMAAQGGAPADIDMPQEVMAGDWDYAGYGW